MARDPLCPKCSLTLARDRAHVCGVDRIEAALEGVDVSGIDRHDRLVRWMAGWEPETVGWLLQVIEAARNAGPRSEAPSPSPSRIVNGRIDYRQCRHTLVSSDGTCGWCWEQVQ